MKKSKTHNRGRYLRVHNRVKQKPIIFSTDEKTNIFFYIVLSFNYRKNVHPTKTDKNCSRQRVHYILIMYEINSTTSLLCFNSNPILIYYSIHAGDLLIILNKVGNRMINKLHFYYTLCRVRGSRRLSQNFPSHSAPCQNP